MHSYFPQGTFSQRQSSNPLDLIFWAIADTGHSTPTGGGNEPRGGENLLTSSRISTEWDLHRDIQPQATEK